jgi:hypothetical protein
MVWGARRFWRCLVAVASAHPISYPQGTGAMFTLRVVSELATVALGVLLLGLTNRANMKFGVEWKWMNG